VEEFAGCGQDAIFGVWCDSHEAIVVDRPVKSRRLLVILF
jgi:hypothetical protein